MKDLTPDQVLASLKNGSLQQLYLFYGHEDFWIELTLDKIKEDFIPESAKEFNLETLYGGENSPQDILDRARLVPFMSSHRLIIVKNTEGFTKKELEHFLPYLNSPVESTCIIWVSGKTDLTGAFYKKFRELDRSVNFKKLSERQAYSWIQKRAGELSLKIDKDASAFLYQMVGGNLRDLFNEVSKLSLRHPGSSIRAEHVKELTAFSRLFTVFDLVDHISKKDSVHAMVVLYRLLEIQGRDATAVLGALGMIARQIRLILKVKSELKKGSGRRGVIKRLSPLPVFVAEKCISQEGFWRERELEEALKNVYNADGLIRIGSKPDLVLESLILLLCFPQR
jgi:DNA polymerase III subunit delta